MRLEWCSITVMQTSSPGVRTVGAKDLATRFRLSEVLRVKTTSFARGLPASSTAPMRRATCSRTAPISAVACTERL